MSRISQAHSHSLRTLAGDVSGLAVVEFAFIASFMILIYLGSQQLADAIFANRKVTTAARTVTDLTTQYSAVTNNELDLILQASAKALSPYSAGNAQIRVSQITIDENEVAKISWSKGMNIAARSTGDTFDLPDDLTVPNTSLVYGEVNYEHNPVIQGFSVGALHLSDDIFMSPRVSASVNLR